MIATFFVAQVVLLIGRFFTIRDAHQEVEFTRAEVKALEPAQQTLNTMIRLREFMTGLAFELKPVFEVMRADPESAYFLKSPCKQQCRYEADKGHCVSCWRTLDEIARWSQMSGAERERVIGQLDDRQKGHPVRHELKS